MDNNGKSYCVSKNHALSHVPLIETEHAHSEILNAKART